MLVTKLGVPHVISKAASEVHGEVLKRLGAEVVYPEADMAVRIGKRLISGNLLDYIALGDLPACNFFIPRRGSFSPFPALYCPASAICSRVMGSS